MKTITIAASVAADNKLIVRQDTLRFLPVLAPRTKKTTAQAQNPSGCNDFL